MTILVAINGEHVPSQTLIEGDTLARQFDEELVAMHVMPEDTFEEVRGDTGSGRSIPFAPGVSYGELSKSGASKSATRAQYTIEDGERDATSVVDDVAADTLDDLDNLTVEGRVGEPVKEILDEAERRDARYIVVGGRKRSSVGKAVFGSATQSVLLETHRPVLVVMRQD